MDRAHPANVRAEHALQGGLGLLVAPPDARLHAAQVGIDLDELRVAQVVLQAHAEVLDPLAQRLRGGSRGGFLLRRPRARGAPRRGGALRRVAHIPA